MRPTWCCALVSLLAASPVDASVIQLNSNAGFDHDIAGVSVQTPPGGGASWAAIDLTGDAGSGSLRLDGPAGTYRVSVCLHPDQQLAPTIRHFYELGVRASGPAGSSLLHEGVFAFGGDLGEECDGPWTGLVRRFSPVPVPQSVDASIPAYAWPLLVVSLAVTKADDQPLLIDDWSISVDEDLIFRDDDEPATVFSL